MPWHETFNNIYSDRKQKKMFDIHFEVILVFYSLLVPFLLFLLMFCFMIRFDCNLWVVMSNSSEASSDFSSAAFAFWPVRRSGPCALSYPVNVGSVRFFLVEGGSSRIMSGQNAAHGTRK